MAGIKTTITLNDAMSSVLRRMWENIRRNTQAFEDMQETAQKPVVTSEAEKANTKLKETASIIERVKSKLAGVREKAKNMGESLKDSFKKPQTEANKLMDTIKKIVGALSLITIGKKVVDFLRDSFEAANIQKRAEIQLQVSLSNIGAVEGAFDEIKAKAQEIQSRGMYGDESMIAAGAEFATYMKDANAIKSMMDTLTNYAAGMSGGGEVGLEEMVQYATNLGKIMTGSFDAMTKKGFEFTEAQKAVIDGTAEHSQYVEVLGEDYKNMSEDMRKAAAINQVIADSWDGLYEAMSNTPEGKVIALKNAWGDFKEMIGSQISPAVSGLTDMATNLINTLAENLPVIEPLIVGITGAVLALAVAKGIYAAATWIATGAAQAFFTALLKNPFTWIAVGIGIVIALLYRWVQSVGGIRIAWEICKTAVIRAWEQMKIGFQRVVYGIISYANHMKADVLSAVEAMVNGVISLINMLISALNKLPGVSISAISQVSFGAVAQAKAAAFDAAAENSLAEQEKESVKDMWKRAQVIKHMQALSGANSTSLIGGGGIAEAVDEIAANTAGGGGSPAGSTAGNTGKMADAMDVMEDILEYMVDIAERETVNRFTTAEIHIDQTNNNSIASGMDLDGIMEQWNDDFTEILQVAAEGVHV